MPKGGSRYQPYGGGSGVYNSYGQPVRNAAAYAATGAPYDLHPCSATPSPLLPHTLTFLCSERSDLFSSACAPSAMFQAPTLDAGTLTLNPARRTFSRAGNYVGNPVAYSGAIEV